MNPAKNSDVACTTNNKFHIFVLSLSDLEYIILCRNISE